MTAARTPDADPDLPPERFRELGYRTVDILTEHFETVRGVRVHPGVDPGTVAAAFDGPLPETGEDPDDTLDAFERDVLPNATHNTSPRFFGYVMGSGSMLGTLADALAAGLNANVAAWPAAPSATEVERQCLRWLTQAVDYPGDSGGLLTSGGTMANVTALLTALRATTDHDSVEEGLQGETPGRYTLYVADHEAHSSVYRAAELLNLGRSAVRLVPSGADFRMDVEALEAFLEADVADGHVPFCVVGQAGSFNVSAVDPLDTIADVCAARDLWFHVDGACGAVAAMVPELADRYAGMERADAVTLDPHKFLSVPYECGAVLVRGFDDLERAFSMEASYLRGSGDEVPRELDFYSYGPQTSRGFRALKLWMLLRHHGLAGYRDLLRKNVACAAHLDGRVRDHGDFLAVQEPNLYIYSFRYVPSDLRSALDPDHPGHERVAEYLDELAGAIVADVVASGLAFLGTTTIRGRRALRTSICSHRTTFEDVDVTFDALAEAGGRIDGAWREDASLPV